MSRRAIIIGAGLAGLSAGIHLQQNGIETEIFELAPWAGGMCTAWVRKGYRFDGCIHWMVGTKPGNDFYNLYREVDALAEDTVIYNAPEIQMEINGTLYNIPMEFEDFKKFLHSLSEEDNAAIDAFCGDVETLMQSKMPSGVPSGLTNMIRVLKESRGFLSIARRYLGVTVEQYAAPFKSETVKALIHNLMPKDFSAVGLIMMLGTRMCGNAGYPMGGALEVMKRIEAKYRALGGNIHFNARVEKILVENGRAVGVISGGKTYPADCVIAACDAYDTLHTMLGGQYRHEKLDELLRSFPVFDPLAVVSFGLNKKFGIPFSVQYEIPEGVHTAPDTVMYGLHLRSFDFDPAAAPEGKSSVMIMTLAPLAYWEDLRKNDFEAYKAKKQELADEIASLLDKRIPGFKEAIEITDVATPATYVRLTNVYKGSYEGFAPTPKGLKTRIRKTIPGVKNLYICGQWTTPGGGICSAVQSGKEAAQLALKGK